MSGALEFVLNGQPVRVADVSINTTLLEFLRARGLVGSKEGCAEGDCGACSVALVDRDSRGRATYRAVNSCLMPLCLLAGREVISVEGVKPGAAPPGVKGCAATLHPVQRAMVEGYGSQCGYCTPGFICSLFEGYYRDDIQTLDELEDQLSGNLCRCTGYRPIRDAAMKAFGERLENTRGDVFAERLKEGVVRLGPVDYECAGEHFLRPGSLAELLRLKDESPEARLIAGATELGLDITKRFRKFPTLISTEAVPEMNRIESTEDEWRVGAAVTLTEIEDLLADEFPALGNMLRVFGSRQIRNRATMGGNIVTASPIGDSAPVLLALDASVVLACKAGERLLPIDQFFVGYRQAALKANEVLRTIRIPRGKTPPGLTRRTEWFKVSKRREMDISTVGACFRVDLDERNRVRDVRLAYGGVAAMPLRARETEARLMNQPWSAETIRNILPVLLSEFTPISDVRGSADYRRGLIAGLLEKFFEEGSGPPVHSGLLADRRADRKREPRLTPPHESAHTHVTGEAVYVDDQTVGMLEVWPVCSPHASARILSRDASEARTMPGIRAVLFAEDVPGLNDVGMRNDEPLLATNEVLYHSHLVALVVGDTADACRAAAEKVVVEYEPLKPLLSIRDAIEQGSFHNEPNFIRRGDAERALNAAPLTLEGEFECGAQEHFYLESHAAHAQCGEDGSIVVTSSSQHPSEVQQVVSHVLDVAAHKVVVQVPRMGGGFGGKETQAATPAALAALAAWHTGRPVRMRFNRDQDMAITGHRHPFFAKFKVGYTGDGVLQAARIHLTSNGGWAQDLSQPVTDRALFHLDNAYYLPAVEFRGQVARTNLASNTAFRGFGGPQGMLVIEEIMDRVARRLGLRPEVVRRRNLYHGTGETNTTHYGQEIADNRLETVWSELFASAAFEVRQTEIAEWNAAHPHRKRGLAITPVKFGISFTLTHLNQAGAFVLIYQDGTVQVNHGGTEMGQGVHTNVAMIVARELGVKLEAVRVMPTSTDKVPNTSATAASATTDLNGAAAKNACDILKTRLLPVACGLLKQELGKEPQPTQVMFEDGEVFDRSRPESRLPFAQVARKAHMERVSLSTTGFYATPGIHWDRAAGRGKPFHYFANCAAVTEVEVDGFTGMHRVLRVDILQDAGDSVNEGVNRGQIEGGFIQGMGWLTSEELVWNDEGVLLTHSPDTYKIPSIGDTPEVFHVTLLKHATQENVVRGSKAVGEPPFMLALSVREALRDAVAAFGSGVGEVPLPVPATCEAIWMAIQARRRGGGDGAPQTEPAAGK
jgi:xanthine dehydrogenase molybdopterin binding subunit/xanthine dehydrogenase small subunit